MSRSCVTHFDVQFDFEKTQLAFSELVKHALVSDS